MINYSSSEVVQCLRQYDMFANSLRLIRNTEERGMIIRQLTKLEEKIISLTNDAYLEEYNELNDKECGLLDEEKKRLTMLIDLINQRLSYVEKRCSSHYQLTGETVNVAAVTGSERLDELENRVRIIDTYSKNMKNKALLEEDIKSLNSKIELANEKMNINESLNTELETTFKNTLTEAFKKLDLYDLENEREQIEYAYYETEKSLSLAELNYEAARKTSSHLLDECISLLKEAEEDYVNYKDKISILKLIDMVSMEADDYDKLLAKRKEINEILKYVRNQDLLNLIIETVNKQYSTIMMEEQDINTLNDLVIERDKKMAALDQIEDENNSDEFQKVLGELIANEKRKQEKILEEQRKLEEIEKKKKLEIERKRQEEILRRQKIIEEARKKEMEKRTKQMLEEQQKPVLQVKKAKDTVSFETIKDTTVIDKEVNKNVDKVDKDVNKEINKDVNKVVKENSKKEEEVVKEDKDIFVKLKDKQDDVFVKPDEKKEKNDFELSDLKMDFAVDGEEEEETPADFSRVSRRTSPIETELFAEFNSISVTEDKEEDQVNNKLPSGTIDEYMKNFSDEDVLNTDDLFDDTSFPSIPL